MDRRQRTHGHNEHDNNCNQYRNRKYTVNTKVRTESDDRFHRVFFWPTEIEARMTQYEPRKPVDDHEVNLEHDGKYKKRKNQQIFHT